MTRIEGTLKTNSVQAVTGQQIEIVLRVIGDDTEYCSIPISECGEGQSLEETFGHQIRHIRALVGNSGKPAAFVEALESLICSDQPVLCRRKK